MELFRKIGLALCVGVVVWFVLTVGGGALASLAFPLAVTIGRAFVSFAAILGAVAAIWFFLSGGKLPMVG